MTDKSIREAALTLIPRVELYYRARRQARWQFRAAAGEHKAVWIAVQHLLDAKILLTEGEIARALDLDAYKGKRVFSE